MQCNIDSKGRRIRGINAVIMIAAAVVCWLVGWSMSLAILLLIGGLLSAFEALKGWCVLRALGIKTKY